LIIAAFLLRIFVATDMYLHPWDERYHALVAKNMISHPLVPTLYDQPVLPIEDPSWVVGHIWLHKQPFPLWSIMLSLKVFGVNEIAVRLPSVLFSLLSVWIIYIMAKALFNQRVGWWAAFLLAIHGLFIELAGGRVATDHIDVLFSALVLIASCFVIFYRRRPLLYIALAGLFSGLAILTKWLPALIVLLFWATLHYRFLLTNIRRSIGHVGLFFLIAAVIVLPWQIYIMLKWPTEAVMEYAYSARHLTEVLDGRTGPWYYFIEKYRLIFGEMILAILIFFGYRMVKRPQKGVLALMVWGLVPLVFFSFSQTKMQGYILFAGPALLILTAYFIDYVNHLRSKLNKKLYYFIIALTLFFPIRYSIERLKIFDPPPLRAKWAEELKSLNKLDLPENVVIFNCQHPIEAMFYSHFTVYHFMPDTSQITMLKKKGYAIGIYDDGNVRIID
jgi:4-amino-4-deoxy-L-arabinose transferase